MTLEIYLNDRDTSEVSIKATAGSTGIMPLLIPLSPLFNAILCWIPFSDHGNNSKVLQNIWKEIHGQI